MYAMVSANPENLDLYLKKGTYKTDNLDSFFKMYGDGALGSRGSITNYSDSHTT
jgi:hypothetical protein